MSLPIQAAVDRLRSLPGVLGCRIQTDADGDVVAVRLSAAEGVDAAALVESAVTVLAKEAGLDVLPDQVHVEQASDAGLALEELEHEGRVRLVGYQTSVSEERTLAEVELALGPTAALGRAEARGAGLAPDLLAQACLDALERLLRGRVSLRLAGLQRTWVGTSEVVCVQVQATEGRSERLHVGAARVEGDLARAAAYAALASMNRRVGRILAGQPRHYDIT